ncbi:MAG: hypothetical protein ABL940_10710, partial [Bacteroidia bacterium]
MIIDVIKILCLFVTLSLTACVFHPLDLRLKCINNTNLPLFIYHDFYLSNDTLINCIDCNSNVKDWNVYDAYDTSSIALNGNYYDKYLSEHPNEILRIFIFSSDTLKKYGWKKASSEYMILKRYDINLQYLQKNNWTI